MVYVHLNLYMGYVCLNYWMGGRNPAYLSLDRTDMYIRGMGGWVDCRNGWMGGLQKLITFFTGKCPDKGGVYTLYTMS